MEGDIEARVRTLWQQAFNERNLDALDAITAPDFLNHNALPGTPRGPEGHRQVAERLWKATPSATGTTSSPIFFRRAQQASQRGADKGKELLAKKLGD